jgi:hypothetical protein
MALFKLSHIFHIQIHHYHLGEHLVKLHGYKFVDHMTLVLQVCQIFLVVFIFSIPHSIQILVLLLKQIFFISPQE